MKKHIYIYEKAITIILSFVMIVGLLGGMKLDARAEGTIIYSIDIKAPGKLEGGKKLPNSTQVTSSTPGVSVEGLEWYEGTDMKTPIPVPEGSTAKYNTPYIMKIRIRAAEGYSYTDDDINGKHLIVNVNDAEKNWDFTGKECNVYCFLPATDPETTHTIKAVNITIDPPVAGKTLAAACNVLTEGVVVEKVEWRAGVDDVTGQAALEGTVYQLRVYLKPEVNYEFGSSVQTIVNGTSGYFNYDTKYVYSEFTATGSKPSDEGVKITDGNDATYKPGSNESLTFRGSGELADFQYVKVDGSEVDPKNYDKSKGSTIIKFKPEYLNTLSNGSHTIEMFWNINGAEKSAAASFYIGEKGGVIVPGNTGTTQPANNTESKPRHICSFEWVITLDPTTGADGLEEYKCTGCGVVQESHPIPASVAVVKDFYGKVKEAPEKGSITYDSGKLYTISDYILKKMAERNDVAVTVKFEYQNKKYQIIFPAGLDYSAVLNDEETMYGYFGAAARLGLKVTGQ